MKKYILLLLCLFSTVSFVRAQSKPDLRTRLLELKRQDQELRANLQPSTMKDTALMLRMVRTDSALTRELQSIVASSGWPDVKAVGQDGLEAAFLVLQHSPDFAFQEKLFPTLQAQSDAGELPKQDVAMLDDRIRMHHNLPQRYGTQFKLGENGELILYKVEDQDHVDERRAEVGLMPLKQYQEILKSVYKTK